MNRLKAVPLMALAVLSAWAVPLLAADKFSGLARVGYVYVDDEGNRGVHQGSYNLYEGAALSLEDFTYRAANGLRLTGNLRNITLNNRNLSLGLTKSRRFGLTLRNSQYRRVYDFDGGSFTRRHRTRADFWVQTNRYVRLFGGYGLTGKKGNQIRLFSPGLNQGRDQVDYTRSDYSFGADLKYQKYNLTVEYRGMAFNDDLTPANDRTSVRYQATASGPVPKYEQVQVYAGFQRFQTAVDHRHDSLITNTVWGGVRYFAPHGINIRSSFIFDRARRKGDFVATDNIAYTARVGKDWRGYGGVVVGYAHHINDDLFDELETDSYSVSAWGRPLKEILVRAEYGSDAEEVKSGRTLTGNEDRTRYRFSVRYDLDQRGHVRLTHSSRDIENDQIGSSAEYMQAAVEMRFHEPEFGELQWSYSLFDGEYANNDGVFGFKDHVLAGDIWSREYGYFQGGFGGTYMRGKEDVDIESFTLRFTGIYTFMADHQLQARYTVHNFDDLADPSPIYSRYYTANVFEISVAKSF